MTDRRVSGVALIVVLAALCFGGWGLYEAGRSRGFRDGRLSVSPSTQVAHAAPAATAARAGESLPSSADESASALPLAEDLLADVAGGADADGNSDTVHATRTGKRYHRESCRFLSKSDIPMSRSEAEAKGLTPCSVCQP